MTERWFALAVSTLVLGAVLVPLTWDAGEDSFPISSYPMFSHERTSSESLITHVVAIAADGTRTPVPPHEVASSAVMQTLVTIQQSVHAGPASARRFCREIAQRLTRSEDAELRASVSVEIETARIDSIRYLGGDRTPLSRELHAHCRVP